MKLIEKGEVINDIYDFNWAFLISNIEKPIEDGVTYIAEVTPDETDGTITFKLKFIAKKQDLICGDCGTNFISHKGMCSSCYVKQL